MCLSFGVNGASVLKFTMHLGSTKEYPYGHPLKTTLYQIEDNVLSSLQHGYHNSNLKGR